MIKFAFWKSPFEISMENCLDSRLQALWWDKAGGRSWKSLEGCKGKPNKKGEVDLEDRSGGGEERMHQRAIFIGMRFKCAREGPS